MNNYHLKLALLNELREVARKEEQILELLEVFEFNFKWLINYCEKHNLIILDKERLYRSLNKVRILIDEISLPPKNKHPFRTPKDSTVYICVHKSLK